MKAPKFFHIPQPVYADNTVARDTHVSDFTSNPYIGEKLTVLATPDCSLSIIINYRTQGYGSINIIHLTPSFVDLI